MSLSTFERVEQKYQINQSQKDELVAFLKSRLILDPYCKNGECYPIYNIYLDCEDDHLIQKSLLKPNYKEKFRLRQYEGQEGMYLEVKKKFQGVVSKRRCSINLEEYERWLKEGKIPIREKYLDKQIIQELDYLLRTYHLQKKVYIAYDRLCFLDQNSDLRITIDSNLRYRRDRLDFKDKDGEAIIPKDQYILEIKNSVNIPLWLIRKIEELSIRRSSFSKYGHEHLLSVKEASLNAN